MTLIYNLTLWNAIRVRSKPRMYIKPIKLTEENWSKICGLIKDSMPMSTVLIRDKMKEVLGFTPRTVRFRNPTKTEVHLDFFDESKKTMFLLKYGDYIKN